MSLSQIQNQILQPFIDETLGNLATMAKMIGHTDEGFCDDPKEFRFKGYAICCETLGHIDGVVIMHHYPETAIAMGNAIRLSVLGEENKFDTINDEMADALAEWGNTVVGRATKNLAAYHLSINFEAPYFIYDTDVMASLLTGVQDIITVPVHVEDVGRFYFNYLIRSVNEEVSKTLSKAKKILIVDDMKMVRSSLKRYLKELGFENIIEAANGQEAIKVHDAEKPDFVFMDVVMPEMNGNEALNKIRQSDKKTPIVMLSSVADQGVIDECEALGISGYIIKPLTVDNGAQTLSRFLM